MFKCLYENNTKCKDVEYKNKLIIHNKGNIVSKFYSVKGEAPFSANEDVDYEKLLGYIPKPEFSILHLYDSRSSLYVINKDIEETYKSLTILNINIWINDHRQMLVDIEDESEALMFALSYVDGSLVRKKEN